MDFAYDVFISYGSEDRAYAERLSESIEELSPKHSCFFDAASLRAGDDWETKIQSALETSRHLIVLWSDHAKQSDWVSRELYTFLLTAKPKVDATRRLIFLNLQGTNEAMKAFQQINQPDLAAGYPSAATITSAIWQDVIRDVEEGLNPEKRLLPVPVVVLTMTKGEVAEFGGERWQQIQNDFGLSQAFLSARYGPTRLDWRPFAGTASIGAVLEDVKNQMSDAFQAYRPYWKFPGDDFWSDVSAAQEFARRDFATGDISVLVVDPIALYRHDIYQRLILFQNSLASDRVVVVTLPPFNPQPKVLRFRTALMNRAKPYFDDFFQPQIPPERRWAAHCGWNVTDLHDIQRLILAAAVQLSPRDEGANGSTFLRHGNRR